MNTKKSDKYELLINSAVQVFVENGYHQTKIKDITDNASLAAGTFYLYFKNKDDILEAILQKHITIIFTELENIVKSDTLSLHKIEAIIRTKINFFIEYRDLFVIHLESMHQNESINHIQKHREYGNRFLKLIIAVIEQGINENQFTDKIDPKISAMCLRGMIIMPLMTVMVINPEENIDVEELISSISYMFIKGIKK